MQFAYRMMSLYCRLIVKLMFDAFWRRLWDSNCTRRVNKVNTHMRMEDNVAFIVNLESHQNCRAPQ